MTVRFPWLLFILAGGYVLWSHLPAEFAQSLQETVLSLPAYDESPARHLAKLAFFLVFVVGLVRLLKRPGEKEDE